MHPLHVSPNILDAHGPYVWQSNIIILFRKSGNQEMVEKDLLLTIKAVAKLQPIGNTKRL